MPYGVSAARLLLALAVLLPATGLTAQQSPKTGSAASAASNTGFIAEVDKLVHVKRAKVEDAVTAHLVAPVTLPNGTELPKGSKLTGVITSLKVKADKEGPSKLGLLFTSVSVKNGAEIPIQVALVSVAPHFHQGEADPLTAGNPYSSGGRMSGGTASGTLNSTTSEGEVLSRGLGARAPSVNVAEGQMHPGVSYLPAVTMASYSATSPGTILVSTAGSVYLDAGSRLLFLVVPR